MNSDSSKATVNSNSSIKDYYGTWKLLPTPLTTIKNLAATELKLPQKVIISKKIFKNGPLEIENPYYYMFEDSHYIGAYSSNYLSNPLVILLASKVPIAKNKLIYSVSKYNSLINSGNYLIQITNTKGIASLYAYYKS